MVDHKQLKSDIEFLLSFAPEERVPEGLIPMFYVTGSYEGDLIIAKRVKEIRERYHITNHNKIKEKQGE